MRICECGKIILRHSLRLINSALLIGGFVLMIGGAGALDYTAEIGTAAGPEIYRQMTMGMIMVLAGFTLKELRDNYGTRENFRTESESLYRAFRRMAG